MRKLCFACLAVAAAFAQPQSTAPAKAPAKASFEVASIKPSGPLDPAAILSGKSHVGMSVDNFRVDVGSMSLLNLICLAYKVKPFQITGIPDWAPSERFDILAKLPDGASKDQVPEMLESLLAERFKLAVHRDKKDQPIYALVVGKNGPKLKEAPSEPAAAPEAPAATEPKPPAKGELTLGSGDQQISIRRADKGAGMVLSTKETGAVHVTVENGLIDMQFERMTMASLIDTLSQYLDRPVVDETGLKGAYQASLRLSLQDAMRTAGKMGVNVPMPPAPSRPGVPGPETASDPAGGSLFTSVEQLGLKLEARKQPYEFLVIDHLEKTPTEN
ncbi:MAG TPA: TIGR03435 family protein [Bryobacteraceae bacterium]|nr:TIGR03435 family protein [Bryobacteraceae bacterium]